MKNKFFWGIIVLLLTINAITITQFQSFKRKTMSYIQTLSQQPDELVTLKTNFQVGIENNDLIIETMQPSSNSLFEHKQDKLLVCRFSEYNCESCVDYAIKSIQASVALIGKENILFLGSYKNNRIFNKHKPLYGIDSLNVRNIFDLNIPAEKLGYPYYFVIDSTFRLLNIFIPDKGTPQITKNYLELTQKRFFPQNQ
jgi:hypothetical protein